MRITGSRVHRVWKCPASAVLPQVDRGDIHAAARGKGKAIHAFLERVGLVGFEVALSESPEDVRPLCKALDLDALPVKLATEVAFAWNWVDFTARELGRNLDRAYHLASRPLDPQCEIALTLDLVGIQAARGYVGDYKTGHSKYPPPDMFGQTLLGALCVRSLYDCDDVVVELIHIHDDGDHDKIRRTVGEWELDAFARQLKDAMTQVLYERDRELVYNEGPWCEHCDAYKACPAKVALVRQIPATLAQLGAAQDPETGELAFRPGAISVRNAADAWMVLERIAEVVNRAKEEVIGIASFEEIPLPDGRVIGRMETSKRQVDGRVGAEVLERRYGREERDRRVKHTLSISAIQDAVVAHLKPGEKVTTRKDDGVLDRLLGEIERLGGLKTVTTESIKPHVPKKKRA